MPKDVEAAPQTKTELIAKRKELFERLRKDNYYRDVAFNEENGGLKAIHVEHNFGFFGSRDGECDRFDLCEDCYRKIVANFPIPVEKWERKELL